MKQWLYSQENEGREVNKIWESGDYYSMNF